MAETLYATFADNALAEKAVGALMDYGVRQEDISLIMKQPDERDRKDREDQVRWADDRVAPVGTAITDRPTTGIDRPLGSEGSSNYQMAADDRDWSTDVEETRAEPHIHRDDEATDLEAKSGLSTTTPADAGSGAAKGAGIGLGLGILGALASIAIPGFGLVYGGGALATAIAAAVGTTVAGAVAGGVYGYLKDQGMPEYAAATYSKQYEAGETIFAVQVPSNNVDKVTVEGVLAKYGASNVNTFPTSYAKAA